MIPSWARRHLVLALSVAFAIGIVLRLVFPGDIVIAKDEEWTFVRVIGEQPVPALGMASSRGIANAGMSIWAFVALGKLGGVTTPEGLARSVAVLALVAHLVAFVIPFKLVREERDRDAWIWGLTLTLTNPIIVYLERKVWAQSLLPIFMLGAIAGWLRRETRTGAMGWGLFSAVIGQIHMAGFFFAPALAGWTFLTERLRKEQRTRWMMSAVGAALGMLPAIPWIRYLLGDRPHATGAPWWHRFRLEFYQYFFSDISGLSAGSYFLETERALASLRYPILGGVPTYLLGVAHVALAIGTVAIVVQVVRDLWARRSTFREIVLDASDTGTLLSATLVGMALLMTLPGIAIHRHYMMATFPLQYVWVARVSHGWKHAWVWLAVLFFGGLAVSAGQLIYIHESGGFLRIR